VEVADEAEDERAEAGVGGVGEAGEDLGEDFLLGRGRGSWAWKVRIVHRSLSVQ
jgi:hypothetical protein